MKGRKPKTKEELKSNGTFRPVYHAKRVEPIQVDELPAPPDDFDARHRERWGVVGRQMMKQGVFSETDYDALRMYVEIDLIRTDAHKMYVKTKEVEYWRIYRDAQQQQKRLMDDMGFTPRSRMSMKVEKPKEEKQDPFVNLLSIGKEDDRPNA